MRKEKLIFIAAVLCTVLSAILIFTVVFLQDVSLLNAAAAAYVCCLLLWMVYHSLTHDCMGRKITSRAEPLRNISRTAPTPESRFVFSEETVREKMGRIAEMFKLKMNFQALHSYKIGFTDYSIHLYGKTNFHIFIDYRGISISAYSLTVYEYLQPYNNEEHYCKQYHFDFLDDSLNGKADVSVEHEYDFEDTFFASDIFFDDLSDNEIFGIIEKMIYVLYGAVSMEYDTAESEDGKKSFTFYLDAPDYYGYTETTEIGNFKFILNKENGGTVNV